MPVARQPALPDTQERTDSATARTFYWNVILSPFVKFDVAAPEIASRCHVWKLRD